MGKDLTQLGLRAEAVPVLDECLRRIASGRAHRNFAEVADLRPRHFRAAGYAAGCRARPNCGRG